MGRLYHKIPKNHILRRINAAINLNFVNNALKDKYYSNRYCPKSENFFLDICSKKPYNIF